MQRKVLIIGIDGATWTILNSAMADGWMPFLQHLIENGASGILDSTVPAVTPAAWSTFQTGVNPGKTGIFDFSAWDKTSKQKYLVSSIGLPRTMWEFVSAAGGRVATVDVPMTYPPRAINGYVISGLPTPSRDSQFTYPDNLKDDLLLAVPSYQISNLEDVPWNDMHDNLEVIVNKMADFMASRVKAAKYILSQEIPDLLMVHFQATDWVQHGYFCYMDEKHQLFDPVKRSFIFENFYYPLDKYIKTIVEAVAQGSGNGMLTMLVSDHGFQSHRYRFSLGKWLHRQEFLSVHNNIAIGPTLIEALKRIDILKLRKKLFQTRIRSGGSRFVSTLIDHKIDFEKSQAIATGLSNEGLIYILSEGDNYHRTLIDLKERLTDVKNPFTGQSVIERIYHKTELYKGPYLNDAPDMVLIPTPGHSFTGDYSPAFDMVHEVIPPVDFLTGRHDYSGIIIASGEAIQGQVGIHANLCDIAPTVLHYLNLDVPVQMDGSVLEKLFVSGFKSASKVKDLPIYGSTSGQDEVVYSPREQEILEKRLQQLGYL